MIGLGKATPVFETPRSVVKQWTLDDVQSFFAIFGEPKVWRFLPGSPPSTAAEASGFLEHMLTRMQHWEGMGSFAMSERESGAVIGNVMLRPLANGPEIEVGYHVAMPYWGQGYATEAARGAVRYGFETLGLEEIFGVVVPDNFASRRVLEKAGLNWIRRDRFYNLDCDVLRVARAT